MKLIYWFKDSMGNIITVAEYEKCLNLKNYIENAKNKKLSKEVIFKFLGQSVGALKALQDEFKVNHRDLKPENLLITTTEDLILCDFGLAKRAASTTIGQTDKVGTENYMAPEVILRTKELKITDSNIKRIMEELFGQQVDDLKKAFADMDIDNNGYVTENELKELLSRRGKYVNDPVISEIMKICDVNGDGVISFAEFVKAATH